ncbi:5'-3' exonuclease [Ureaplasma diversum]|uniref:5'-3' exonuclease n=1 Tax=Ureaplasma diversum NCTC 246 TaxID=1188241 RepID=A0A084EXS8_9BACT|nr:5'-3' exonuclease [Ureaplasma diversum]KEZ22770.1 DNA polymerase I (5'-3' exonuclease domain) [Ureaplasma diversum NCTC 246]
MNNKKAVVIDANSLIYRAFHATYKQAEWSVDNNMLPTNAIKLVGIMIFKILNEQKYDYALVALDSKAKTKRAMEYENYKATRKPMDDKLVVQLPYIYELFSLMGLKTIAEPGIEADDFVGSFACLMNKYDIYTDVYSSDKDLLQLVNANTSVCLLKKGVNDILVNTISNFSDFNDGLLPNQITDYKGLVGDLSDNLPGVKGIGAKTALSLILKYKDLETIYEQIDSLAPSTKNKLINSYEQAMMCKKLATIDTKLLVDFKLEDFVLEPYKIDQLDQFFTKLKIQNVANYYKQ